MALPSSSDVSTLDFALNGRPMVILPASGAVSILTMDYALGGNPVVGNPSGVLGPANLKSLFGVAKANIKSINGVPLANIKSINGVS